MTSDVPAAQKRPGFQQRTFEILEGRFETPYAKVVNGFIVALVLFNVAAVILESEAMLHTRYSSTFIAIEVFSVAVFTVEYLFRLWCWPADPRLKDRSSIRARVKFIFSPMGLIDLLAIAPFYLAMIFAVDLRYLRLLRLLRLLKISHYFRGLDLFVEVLKSEARAISSAIVTVLMLIVVIAAMMFMFEHEAQPEAFGSILQSIWWSVVTLTTVGYGDVTPITFSGRILAIIIMLLGVGLVALPAGILAAKFSDELRTRKLTLSEHISVALEDGIITSEEYETLIRKSDELRLSDNVLDQMIETRRGSSADLVCPHCGHAISLQLGDPPEVPVEEN